MPISQIVLGVPAYGHSFRVRKADTYVSASNSSSSSSSSYALHADEESAEKKRLGLYPKSDAEDKPAGDAWEDAAGTDVCGAEMGLGGNWDLWALVREGWISAEEKPRPGVDAVWDDYAKTTYV
jgi:chitinase